MAQRYGWATPERVSRLSYPQLRTYLMTEYEPPYRPWKKRTVWLSAEEALELQRSIMEKNNVVG
jgi:hypothetical protein